MFQLSLSTSLTPPTAPGAGPVPAPSDAFSAALAGLTEAVEAPASPASAAIPPRQTGAEPGKSLPTDAGASDADPLLAWLGSCKPGVKAASGVVAPAPVVENEPMLPAQALPPQNVDVGAIAAALPILAVPIAAEPDAGPSVDRSAAPPSKEGDQAAVAALALAGDATAPIIMLPHRIAPDEPTNDRIGAAPQKHRDRPASKIFFDAAPIIVPMPVMVAMPPIIDASPTPAPKASATPPAVSRVVPSPAAIASASVPMVTGNGIDTPVMTPAAAAAPVADEVPPETAGPFAPAPPVAGKSIDVSATPAHQGGEQSDAPAHPVSLPASNDGRHDVGGVQIAPAGGLKAPPLPAAPPIVRATPADARIAPDPIPALSGDAAATPVGTPRQTTTPVTKPATATAGKPIAPLQPGLARSASPQSTRAPAPAAVTTPIPVAASPVPAETVASPIGAPVRAPVVAAISATAATSLAPEIKLSPTPAAAASPTAPAASHAPVVPADAPRLAAAAPAAQPAGMMFGIALGGPVIDRRATDRTSPRDEALQALTSLTASGSAAPIAAAGGAQHGALDMRRDDWPQAMIDRIEALRDAADATSTRITLAPDALGKVDLSIRHDGDAVHIHFAADAAQTRAILADAQPRLAELAQARGLRLGQATVDAGAGGQGQRQQPGAAPAPQPQRPPSAFTATTADEAAADPTRLA